MSDKMKKFFVFFLLITMLQTLRAGVSGPSATTNPLDPQPQGYDFTVDGIYYKIRPTAEPEVSTSEGDKLYKGKVTIPDEVSYNGKIYKVTRVAGFNNSPYVTSITIPKYVRRISTFYGAREAWYNPSIIKASGNRAAADASQGKLKEVIFNAVACDTCQYKYEPLSSFAWQGYKMVFPSTVEKITIGEGVTKLPYRCFYDCSSVTDLVLPKSVKIVESEIFGTGNISNFVLDCENLSELRWRPDNFTAIKFGENFGTFCEGILRTSDSFDTFVCPPSVTRILSGSFKGTIRKIVLPAGLKRIEAYTFSSSSSNFSGLEEINLPESLEYIGSYAFRGANFNKLVVPSGSMLGKNALNGCSIKRMVVRRAYLPQPDGAYGSPEELVLERGMAPKNMFINNANLRKVTICEGVDAIDENAFKGCNIRELSLPKSIKRFGKDAFDVTFAEGCDVYIDNCILEENGIPLSANVHLGKVMLQADTSLYDMLRMPINLHILSGFGKKIPDDFTTYKYRLEKVDIDEGIECIGKRAFAGCIHLLSLSLPSSLRTVEDSAFAGCEISTLSLSPGIQTIGNYAFRDIAVKNLELFKGLRTIGKGAFENAWRIKSLILPDGLEEIGAGAFSGLGNTTTLQLPATGLRSIGDYAFRSTNNISSIVLPEGLKYIGKSAFEFSRIKKLDFPSSLTAVGDSAFYSSPVTCTIPRTLESLGDHAFQAADDITLESLDFMTEEAEGKLKYYIAAKRISLPRDMKEIPRFFFLNMQILREVDMPEGLEKIDLNAFLYSGIESVTLPSTVVYVHPTAFEIGEIKTVYSKAVLPPSDFVNFSAASRSSGRWSYLNSMSLYVPVGCKQAYSNHEFWSNFGNIEELEELGMAGIDQVIIDSEPYALQGDCLTSRSRNIFIYTLTGTLLFEGRGEVRLPKGIYVVHNGKDGKSEKIFVN